VFGVTQNAIASALKVIMRADDSSGIIGDAFRARLDLHPKAAALAKPPVAKIVDWMMKFQFHSDCDYFTIDPVAYARAWRAGHRLLPGQARRFPALAISEYRRAAVSRRRPDVATHRDDVMGRLAASPPDAVLFALLSLKDVRYAWQLAHSLGLNDNRTWSESAKGYEKVDPHRRASRAQSTRPERAGRDRAQHYQVAARRLAKMRKLAAGTNHVAEVDWLIAELRESNRRRPRLQQEFDRAGLP
jgi:hypothetical protein